VLTHIASDERRESAEAGELERIPRAEIRAAGDLQRIRMDFRSSERPGVGRRERRRLVWPIMLGFFEDRRIVAGWCELRQDFRSFRTDRIEHITLLEERYPGRRRDLAKRWRDQADEQRKRDLRKPQEV